MRLRVVAAEPLIASRLSRGEEDYHEAFGGMTLNTPILLMTLVIGTVTLSFPAFSGDLPVLSPLSIFNILSIYVASLAVSTVVWVFATASWGLHKLGGSSLKLGSFRDDRMMGTKPLGNLALSLTVGYFGGLLLTILLFSGDVVRSFSLQALLASLLLLGVGMFFLPLNSIHRKMQGEKRRLQREIGSRYPNLSQPSSQSTDEASIGDVRDAVNRLTELQQLEMLDRKVASLPTWPFDIQLVSKFITIVLSVSAVLLSRVITGFLHI